MNVLNKPLLLAIFIGLIVLGYVFLDPQELFVLLKKSQGQWTQNFANAPIQVLFMYCLIYIIVCAFSLPISTVLSLTGGAIFGLGLGVVTVSFASTFGACAAFLLARLFFHNWFQNKYEDKLKMINEGFDNKGSMYLVSMRLMPIFPFFLINFLMGLTKIKLKNYYFATQLGMIPANIVFVYAGTELGKIEHFEQAVSLKVLAILSLLALFPLIMKKIMNKSTKQQEITD